MDHSSRRRFSCLIISAALLWPAAGTAQEIGVVLQRPAGAAPAESVSADADFVVRPSILPCSNPGADQPERLDLEAFCIDLFTGQILPNCDIQLTVRARPGSGGHLHNEANRPAGAFEPSSGNSGSDGLLETTYKSPEVSGIMEVTITGRLPDRPVLPGFATIGVEIPLSTLPASGTGYSTLTSVGHGANNLSASPSVVTNLRQVPVSFSQLVLATNPDAVVPTLVYTSLNLIQGGLFDVDASGDGRVDNPWRPPHCSHRTGVDADLRIRNVPAVQRPMLQRAIEANGFRFPVRAESPQVAGASHWHLRAR